jgi:DNA replication and repair protein RecF
MWLAELALAGFRNLAEQKISFDPRVNLVFGANGAGKTNLLEAIALLASGRSFRTFHDIQLLGFNAPHFRVAGRAVNEKNRQWQARVYFSPAERKHYFLDRSEIAKRSLFAGWLPASVFLLDDRRLISGAPAQRRAFLDDAVGKVSRTYRFVLSEFRKLLSYRNALLRRRGHDDEFTIWEKRLADQARQISQRRHDYWQLFSEHFEHLSRRFLPNDYLTVTYMPDVEDMSSYPDLLRVSRIQEEKMGYTRRGPHRDDFRVLLNSRPIRSYGSYGQQRLAALALSLAEAETALDSGRRPIYLMDDVAAELDDYNERLLFELVKSKGQIFYAAARPPAVEGQRINVKKGKIRKV